MKITNALSKLSLITLFLLTLAVSPLSNVSAAAPIYVQPGGDDTLCDGTLPVDYSAGVAPTCAVKTIQKGVDLVDSGGTVYVAAGNYDERVTINKALSLNGATAGVSKKDYVPPAAPAYAYDTNVESVIRPTTDLDISVMKITVDDVVVDGFVVANTAILVAGNTKNLIEFPQTTNLPIGIEIRNSVVGPNTGPSQNGTLGRFGIVAPGPSASSGIKTRIFSIHDNYVYGNLGNGGAIAFIGAMDTGIEDNAGSLIANNTITGNHRSGIEFAGSLTGTVDNPFLVTGNSITDNGKYAEADAAVLKYGNGITFIRIGSDRTNGVPYGVPENILISENLIEDNEKNGVYIGPIANNLTFEKNIINNNGNAGGAYQSWDGIRIDLVEAYYSASDPAITNALNNVIIQDSLITGNGSLGVNLLGGTPDSGPIGAACNWWEVISGPTETSNPGGEGESISTGFTFAPWLIYNTDSSTDTGFQLPASLSVTPPGDVSEAVNDFTTLQNAVACAVDGQTIDINGPYTWATSNPLANTAYLTSYADTDYGDIRGLEIPEGVDDLTITSTLGTAHILGAGDVDDSGTVIFSSFLFGEDAPGNTNLTVENLLIEDFEGAITLGWNAVGSYSGTMIQDNEIILAGDNSDDSDWMQNIAFYFWVGSNQTIQNNTVTFQADGAHTGTASSASFGFQSGTSGGSAYNGLLIDGNVFQVGETSTGTEGVFGIWENSHNDVAGTQIHLTNNQFLGREGDDFDHAFRLTSQTDGLLISGNILDRVDEVFMAMRTSYHTDGDHYAFTGNTLTNVGGADGIFLNNLTYQDTPFDIPIYWDTSNTIDGEAGIRSLNELSTDATHAARPSSGATVIESVFITPADATSVFVDDNWSGEDRFSDPDGIGAGNIVAYAFNGLDTIQAGVDVATSGGVVNVAAGTFQENVLVNKIVSILGAGSGNTDTDTIVTSPLGVDSKVGVFQVTATGNSGASILLSGMQVQPIGQAGVSIGRFTESTGTSVAYLTLDNLFVIGTNNNAQTEQERGLYVDNTSTLDHLTVIDSAFNNLAYGWYFQKAVSAETSTVSNVMVTDTTFNHNNLKGLYAEKLTEASFIDCSFSENGFDATGLPSYFIPWMAGVDINLKAGSYQNIAFTDSQITNNALGGAQHGIGITIKARDDGATYSAFPATLDNVTITSNNITGNERGIRIGEPGKNNAGPTNVEVSFNRVFGNIQTYTGTDGSAYGGIVNQSLAAVTAENNWWGCNAGSNQTGCDTLVGDVDADPWLVLNAEIPTGDLVIGQTYTISADLTRNNIGTDTSVIDTITNWAKAAFTEMFGSFDSAEEYFIDGRVSSVYVPSSAGMDTICVGFDHESICVDRTTEYRIYMPIIIR